MKISKLLLASIFAIITFATYAQNPGETEKDLAAKAKSDSEVVKRAQNG